MREFVSKLGQREVVPENVTVCIVRREWQHIDLLVLCQKENTCCVSKIKCSLKNTIISFAVIGTCY